MPSLKDLKNRIASVKSTRKITSAMKMVAASKFRRAQESAEASRPYASRMAQILAYLVSKTNFEDGAPPLLVGNGKEDKILLIVMTSDRGLCGGFNGYVVRETRRQVERLEAEGKEVKLICVGRKGRDLLRRQHADKLLHAQETSVGKRVAFSDADDLAQRILDLFDKGEFDVARIVYNKFHSAISQVVTVGQLIPLPPMEVQESQEESDEPQALCEIFEPSREEIIAKLLPRNISVQLLSCLHESAAGEQGSRMTAMDNATRNAGDMIDELTLNYNRSRQSSITRELIEIISGAQAV